MATQTRIAYVYDQLADILANTKEEKTALQAFRAMRNLNTIGSLFAVKPRLIENRRDATMRLDQIADQVYRDLDRGLAYSKIATNLRVDARRVRKLKQAWDNTPKFVKAEHRERWRRTPQQQADLLEEGRDLGNRRVLARRPVIPD